MLTPLRVSSIIEQVSENKLRFSSKLLSKTQNLDNCVSYRIYNPTYRNMPTYSYNIKIINHILICLYNSNRYIYIR